MEVPTPTCTIACSIVMIRRKVYMQLVLEREHLDKNKVIFIKCINLYMTIIT